MTDQKAPASPPPLTAAEFAAIQERDANGDPGDGIDGHIQACEDRFRLVATVRAKDAEIAGIREELDAALDLLARCVTRGERAESLSQEKEGRASVSAPMVVPDAMLADDYARLRSAATHRLAKGHNDTCSAELVKGAICDCGQARLENALKETGGIRAIEAALAAREP